MADMRPARGCPALASPDATGRLVFPHNGEWVKIQKVF
jgi:hypothetical protein